MRVVRDVGLRIRVLVGLLVLPLVLAAGCPGPFGEPGVTPVPSQITLPGDDVSVPIALVNNLTFVDVTIDGTGPYKFVLDTASALTLVSPSIAAQFPGSLLDVSTQIVGPSGAVEARFMQINSLRISDIDFEVFSAAVTEVAPIFSGLPFTVHGILGISLFRPVVLTLDYPGHQIRVQNGVLPAVDDCRILPVTGGDLTGIASYTLPEMSITVQGQTLSAPIDSGNSGFLLLSSSFTPLSFTAPPTPISSQTVSGQISLLQGTLDGSVAFGCVRYDRPSVTVGGALTSLGAVAMRPYVVTIDQNSKRVRFATP